MKKTVFSAFLLFAFFVIPPFATAQQEWQWGKRGQFPTKDIAVDNKGNTYVLWPIAEQANVDGHAIPGQGSTDIAVSSFRCDGSYRWTKVIGSTGPDAGLAIGTDTLGGVYILGNNGSSNSASTYVDDDTVINPTLKKILLVKYDTAGNFKWLRMPEPDNLTMPTNSGAFNLTVEPNGNTHIMALLVSGTYGGSYTASFANDKNIYALKYNRDGTFSGGLHFDITRSSTGITAYGLGLIYDPATSQYYYSGVRLEPNQITFGTTAITGSNFLACFSNAGSAVWARKSNNDAIMTSFIGDPAVDNSGNIYVTGYSYNDFNGGAGDGFGTYDFNNDLGVYGFPIMVKFNASGVVQYATNASVNTDNSGKAVACVNGVAGLACEYGGGNFEWDNHHLSPNNQYVNNFLVRFNAGTGAVMGLDTLNSGPGVNEYATVLTADRNGNFYMGGEFQGTLIVDGVTLNKQDGNSDGYIAKFGSGNCNCTTPVSAFSSNVNGLNAVFTYNGATPVDSVVWSFGDSQSATGLTVNHSYAASGTYSACATAYNTCGTGQHCASVTVSGGGTAIGTGAGFTGITIFPNPAQQELHLEGLPAGARYQLYNTLGILVQEGQLPERHGVISMEQCAAGWYTLVLQDNTGRKGQWKIIRQ